MSFPSESFVIDPDEILATDIIIEDRKLVALGGNERATQASNTAAKSSFYAKIIESLATSIRSKEMNENVEWNLTAYRCATEKIINLVTKSKTALKRFIWFRQFPKPHYIVMSREQTINKLANDLDCQMRKLKARELKNDNVPAPKPSGKNTRRRYGQRLILKVCRALQKGMTPFHAASLLDRPLIQSQELAVDDSNNSSQCDATKVKRQETEMERNIRLLVRHRFLACVRSKKCLFDFANALLSLWGLPNVAKQFPPTKKRKKLVPPTAVDAVVPKKARKVDVPENDIPIENIVGPWSLEERMAFLEGLKQHGFPNWKQIAEYIPTRTHPQVSAYGRSLVRKYRITGDGRSNEKLLEHLHRPDELRYKKRMSL